MTNVFSLIVSLIGALKKAFNKRAKKKIAPPDNVVSILERQPHMSGPALCLNCKHTWTGIVPLGLINLECPACGLFKGVFNSIAFPDTMIICTHCGNVHFCVSYTGDITCTHCGEIQKYEPDIAS